VNEVFVFDIGKAVDAPGEDTGEMSDSLSEVDGVGKEWCLRFCDIIVSLTVSIFSSFWGSWCAMGFGGEVGASGF
jgi:hypothetical protein